MDRKKARGVRQVKYRPTGAGGPKRVVREKAAAPEATVSTTMRLRASLRTALELAAHRDRRSVAEVAQELLEEGLRMRACPGIYFATEPSGRVAKIAGTGLGVWEVLGDFVEDQDVELLKKAFHELSASQIRAALFYFNCYPDEVRVRIDANAALTPEVIEQRYPGLIRVVRVD